MQTIHILLIDDNKEYCLSLKNKARTIGLGNFNANIIINDFQHLDKGFEELNKVDDKYSAVILDAKGLLNEEQETDRTDFLAAALSNLQDYHQTKGFIPFSVCTGFYDRFKEDYDTTIIRRKGKLFDKSTEEDLMIKYLMEEISKSENTKIESKYKDIFEIFELDYLNISIKSNLLSILKKLDNTTNVKDNFNPLRKILEEVYNSIKQKDNNLIPDEVFRGRGGINLEWTWRYLSGLPVTVNGNNFQTTALFLKHISAVTKEVEELSSTISHRYNEYVNIYAYKSAVFALLETLLWFKQLMKTL